MAITEYDSENNILRIRRTDNTNMSEVPTEDNRQLRGFILTVVDNEEQLKEMQEGEFKNMKLSPVLAPTEDDAVKLVSEQGKIILNVTNYEFLKLQVNLIEQLAAQKNINILELKLFDVNMTEE